MCLAVPAKIIAMDAEQNEMALVELDGLRKEVSLALVPEARVGDYVVVHVGFALSVLDCRDAEATLAELESLA